MIRLLAQLLLGLLVVAQGSHAQFEEDVWGSRTRPYIVGHRGAPTYLPEHSLQSYQLAISTGADFIECDVVLSKDLVPLCRHEPALSLTTNVMNTSFAERVTKRMIDGTEVEDVFTVDLTWEELQTLTARQKDALFRPTTFDNEFKIVSLEDYLKLATTANRTVGIYPELKHPTFFNALPQVVEANTTFQDIVLDMLKQYKYDGPYGSPAWLQQPVFIQSFEQDDLVYLSTKTCIPLVQLLDSPGFVTPDRNKSYEQMIEDASLDEIASYATGAGPWKNMLFEEKDGALASTGVIEKLHQRGLQVHLYTLRPEQQYINPILNNQTQFNEFDFLFKELGADGAFTDAPAVLWSYHEAQRIANRPWAQEALQRLNVRPSCKQAPAQPQQLQN